jgi:hypothetical protein
MGATAEAAVAHQEPTGDSGAAFPHSGVWQQMNSERGNETHAVSADFTGHTVQRRALFNHLVGSG